MDMRYEAFCFADRVFYDTPSRLDGEQGRFEVVDRTLPDGWAQADQDTWVVLRPAGCEPRMQGWKVHVSAGLDNAEKVLNVAWEYCVANDVSFKFLRSRQVLIAQNSKYAPRGSSGKLVTIYPRDDGELRRVLDDLSVALDGEHGPYVLSDLRWGAGPLYVRYGGFLGQMCPGPNGELVPAIARADGTLIPDERKPVFEVPSWVTPPGFFAPHLAARLRHDAPEDFPYAIERVLHFSNGGGVYVAERRADGVRVVLKEARPYAGLDNDGSGRRSPRWNGSPGSRGCLGCTTPSSCGSTISSSSSSSRAGRSTGGSCRTTR
jgi:hypothetical protein